MSNILRCTSCGGSVQAGAMSGTFAFCPFCGGQLDTAPGVPPSSAAAAEAFLLQAQALEGRADGRAAVEAYGRVLDIDPQNPLALSGLQRAMGIITLPNLFVLRQPAAHPALASYPLHLVVNGQSLGSLAEGGHASFVLPVGSYEAIFSMDAFRHSAPVAFSVRNCFSRVSLACRMATTGPVAFFT